ncbi:helix-turn-helix domain-containing protein [Pelagibius litoralis]|uniref:Helix-turn-helix domain-containing protein n=1 Tax=Pelagibius litoralis TaxID=374515 RepID=A0A967EV34_9PROT|nr:helix-turn-helix domain-containing protein [Pelagibius litoralis]
MNHSVAYTSITKAQVRAARGLLYWRQHDLAERAGISQRTVMKLERGNGPLSVQRGTLQGILRSFSDAGVSMVNQDGAIGVVFASAGGGE